MYSCTVNVHVQCNTFSTVVALAVLSCTNILYLELQDVIAMKESVVGGLGPAREVFTKIQVDSRATVAVLHS